MSLSGINLSLLIGPAVPIPATPDIMQAFESLKITHDDKELSGFEVTFQAGRSGPQDLLDYALMRNPLLKISNRVVIVVTFNAIPRVLMDGIITNRQLTPGGNPGETKITITGKDISCKMDIEEVSAEHPAQPEPIIAAKIILTYVQYGMTPMVIPPLFLDIPIPIERIPVQTGTDFEFLTTLAKRFGYVFYVTPGPLPLSNTAYWGPPVRVGIPQKAITVDMGHDTNVDNINFNHDASKAKKVSGKVQDRQLNETFPIETFLSMRIPLALFPDQVVNHTNIRTEKQKCANGLTFSQAYGRAQGETDSSSDEVVTVTGDLDALKYGELLMPRKLVGLRGAGYMHDGFYYVKKITHNISKDSYKQNFVIAREGLGSTTPVVMS